FRGFEISVRISLAGPRAEGYAQLQPLDAPGQFESHDSCVLPCLRNRALPMRQFSRDVRCRDPQVPEPFDMAYRWPPELVLEEIPQMIERSAARVPGQKPELHGPRPMEICLLSPDSFRQLLVLVVDPTDSSFRRIIG